MTDAVLPALVGQTITSVRRVFYVAPDGVDRSRGRLDLILGTRITSMDSGADGESLDVGDTPWSDPFEKAASPENDEYVRTHGKWAAFDVSAEAAWHPVIGDVVRDLDHVTQGRKLTGVVLRLDRSTITVSVIADDLVVDVSPAAPAGGGSAGGGLRRSDSDRPHH